MKAGGGLWSPLGWRFALIYLFTARTPKEIPNATAARDTTTEIPMVAPEDRPLAELEVGGLAGF